ncbi:patatin-like phospholipase family protein [Solibaculum mannosilyticum]|uniref:PNPLA domain-containing protein n=1 Tax=Solibaculum mannosilyticum TaxID=2780922 RepID=A0A7I8D2N3_9FIRM|nr:patatin-like phospholipase family protein [Solibaculum mannosilyticum]BCI59972.1 hypothetical protein C12CBH8_06110 [Solibaculum mannosilyticum]CZT57119.1 NTE family protein RssA [Eubacteriaceae bacterium CHKCI005]
MKIGIALSGGGVRGAAHIGVLKALEEAGFEIGWISGTSSGSLVATLYAAGYTPDQIGKIFRRFSGCDGHSPRIIDPDYCGIVRAPVRQVFGKPFRLTGFIKGDKITETIRSLCEAKGFSIMRKSRIPLAMPSVDIYTSRTVMFVSDAARFPKNHDIRYVDSVSPWLAARASIAFPAIFRPVCFENHMLCDGGIKDNLPMEVLNGLGASHKIGVNLGYAGQCQCAIDNAFEIAAQTVNIMSYEITKCNLRGQTAVLIHPGIEDVSLLDLSSIPQCIQRGYEAAVESLPQLNRLLGLQNPVARLA